MLIGAAIGACTGAVVGAIVTKGDRGAAAVYGAVLFAIIGTGFGYKACGP